MNHISLQPWLRKTLAWGLVALLSCGSMSAAMAQETAEAKSRPDEIEARVAMRDGVQLLTYVNLPAGEGPFPAVLVRTPYLLNIIPRHTPAMDAYLDAGYAVVWQLNRGLGGNPGTYRFIADDRNDGYDCIEWIADQPWSNGKVGMDHGSYNGMTQMQAASTRPPALKAIIPFVPSAHFFRETPYIGGIFMRYHMLNWHKVLAVKSMDDLDVGFMDSTKVIDDPEWKKRLTSRPLINAADGFLEGAQLAQYKAFLQHPTLDEDYWPDIMLMDGDYANIDIPVLLVSGNFDPTTGTLYSWQQLEKNAGKPQNRKLLIGPWTHATSYVGIAQDRGPYTFEGKGNLDLSALRIAFFDRYLKDLPPSVALPERVRVYVTGSNQWREFDDIPVPQRKDTPMYLASGGQANSSRGDGRVQGTPASGASSDRMTSDPEHPVVALINLMDGVADFQESQQNPDVLVYDSAPLEQSLTFIGESTAVIHVSASTPDADLVINLHEVFPDGRAIRLGTGGGLRLRYREGFDRQVMLTPGEVYPVNILLSYVSHTLAAGNRLRVSVSGTEYPLLDPNPNTGEDIGTAVRMQKSEITVHHSPQHPSRIELPVVEL